MDKRKAYERSIPARYIALVLPADTPAGLPAGRWRRLPDGRLLVRYTRHELAWALALVGNDSPAVRNALAAGANGRESKRLNQLRGEL